DDVIPGLSDSVERRTERTTVQVANLDTPWLPLPYPTVRVAGEASEWEWDAADLTMGSEEIFARGQNYRATSLVLTPTPQELLAAGAIVPEELLPLTVLPEGVPEIITQTAQVVTAGFDSHYEQAVAIQQYLRTGDFRYSEDAPVREGY